MKTEAIEFEKWLLKNGIDNVVVNGTVYSENQPENADNWVYLSDVLQMFSRKQQDQIDKLQAFKDYVHKRLDDVGIEKEPNGEHSKAGCRIGDRLDILINQKEKNGLKNKERLREEIIIAIARHHAVIGITKVQEGLYLADLIMEKITSYNNELINLCSEAMGEQPKEWRDRFKKIINNSNL